MKRCSFYKSDPGAGWETKKYIERGSSPMYSDHKCLLKKYYDFLQHRTGTGCPSSVSEDEYCAEGSQFVWTLYQSSSQKMSLGLELLQLMRTQICISNLELTELPGPFSPLQNNTSRSHSPQHHCQ